MPPVTYEDGSTDENGVLEDPPEVAVKYEELDAVFKKLCDNEAKELAFEQESSGDEEETDDDDSSANDAPKVCLLLL